MPLGTTKTSEQPAASTIQAPSLVTQHAMAQPSSSIVPPPTIFDTLLGEQPFTALDQLLESIPIPTPSNFV